MKKQCSYLFEKVFDSHGGGCSRTCSCGREHFDSSDNGWSWEDGELEDLIQKSKENPDKYIEHTNTVGCMEIDGKDIVYDCVCDLAEKYEKFIINNEERLAEYLNKRATMLREKAAKIEVPL